MSSPLTTRYIPINIKLKALSLIRLPSHSDHKGSSGRIVVIGGSRDYVGAPYFSAMCALRAGIDMVTVVCPPSAAVPLKSQSPDIIVRALIPPPARSKGAVDVSSFGHTVESAIKELETLKDKSHAFIIGPGLTTDTDNEIDEKFVRWIEDNLLLGTGNDNNEKSSPPPPVIIDASGIGLLASALARRGESISKKSSGEAPIRTLPTIIVTPNVNEIKTLYRSVSEGKHGDEKNDTMSTQTMAVEVSRRMRCCVLLKEFEDFIAIDGIGFGKVSLNLSDDAGGSGDDNEKDIEDLSSLSPTEALKALLRSSKVKPSPRRSAGQGDVLSGFVGAFLAWGYIKDSQQTAKQQVQEDRDLMAYVEQNSAKDSPVTIANDQILMSLQCAVSATLAVKYSALVTEARMHTSRFITSDILLSISEVVDALAKRALK